MHRPVANLSLLKSPEFPQGVITKVVTPGQKWRVKYAATEWFALAHKPVNFAVGDSVKILGMHSAVTLLVDLPDPLQDN